LVYGCAEALVARIFNQSSGQSARTCAIPPEQAFAAVVDDDDFEIPECLPGERAKALGKPGIRSQGGNYD